MFLGFHYLFSFSFGINVVQAFTDPHVVYACRRLRATTVNRCVNIIYVVWTIWFYFDYVDIHERHEFYVFLVLFLLLFISSNCDAYFS